MSDELLLGLFGKVPRDSDRALVIYPVRGQSAVAWYGMSVEQVAEVLYQMADMIVDQRIPPPDWRQRISGG